MTNQKDLFSAIVEQAMKNPEFTHMRPVIEKELLHYDILFCLDKANLLDSLTFQGGTALRLCYGGNRFSEDLDFSGGKNLQPESLLELKNCIEDYLSYRYKLDVHIKESKTDKPLRLVNVSNWQIHIVTKPKQRDMPTQKINIQITNVPAYTRTPRALLRNYDFLPNGYSDILVLTEDLDEILADKIVAFVNTKKHIRYRDIWDIRWLLQQGVALRIDLIRQKIDDYQIENYLEKTTLTLDELHSVIYSKSFKNEMARFIPLEAQAKTLQKEKFYLFLENTITELFKNIRNQLTNRVD